MTEAYFEWLVVKTGMDRFTKNLAKTHWVLLEILFKTQFVVWHVMDDNQIGYAQYMRETFAYETQRDVPQSWIDGEISLLEVLVVLSERLSDLISNPVEWFWTMLQNANLEAFTDEILNDPAGQPREEVKKLLDELMDGRRSFFPITDTDISKFPELHGEGLNRRALDMWSQANYWIRAVYNL